MNEYEKKQYLLRKTIIQATTLKPKNFNFKIDGKNSNINNAYEFIYNNPICEINTIAGNENLITLNLKLNKTNQMTNIDLQNVYSRVFERTK